jgi:hypothetical protein
MATELCVATSGLLRILSGASPTTTAPSPPSIVGVTAQDSQVLVRYSAPVSDGGSPLLSYTVSVIPGTHVVPGISPAVFSQTVTGLTNGTAYTATVTAINAIGSSTSTPSGTVTPAASGQGTGFGGGIPGWQQVKNVTNGLPQGLPGDTRSPATLVTAESLGLAIGGGSYRLNSARTFDSVLFTGPVLIGATNGPMIFTRCAFRRTVTQAESYCGITTTPAVTPVNRPQCFDCDFDGGGVWALTPNSDGTHAGHAPGGAMNCPSSGYKIVRCYIHGSVHCLDLITSSSIVDQCYMDNVVQAYGNASTTTVSHNDVIQWFGTGSTGAQVTNSVLDCYNYDVNQSGNTSVIQNGGSWTSSSVMHNVLVDSCVLSHAGYSVRIESLGPADVLNYQYSNNRFEPNMKFAPNAGVDSRVTWTNNTWNSDGTLSNGTRVTAGQLVT